MSSYFSLEPNSGNYLEPEDALKIIIKNFKNYHLDEEAAKKEVAERLKFLRDLNAAQELIDIYENSNPIRCLIYNEDKSSHLSFDINNNQGFFIFPECKKIEEMGMTHLIEKLAEKADYKILVESEG
ncbi:MAG: hypothetical protein NE334_01005 [Lentisphaeraceae bacterium]|nr:hypothetical protein [Lentisphaeraceae bacterium]